MPWKDAVLELTYIAEAEDPDIVTLLVGKSNEARYFFLHKTLLRLSSNRLKTLLLLDENKCYLPDVTPNIFAEIVKHIYTFSEWEFNGNLIDACVLFEAAMYFGLEELIHSIHKTISESSLEEMGLTCDTACFVYDALRKTSFVDEGKMKEVILSYICKNAQSILILDSFLNLSLDGLLEILRRDDLLVDSELDVFKAVMSWGNNILEKNSKWPSLENLQDVLREPLKCIRFSKMSLFESQHYVKRMGFLPVKQEISSTGSSDASAEKPRKYSHSAGTSKITVDILQADLYVSKFKFQEEASVWKSMLFELNEQTRRALVSKESSQKEVKELAAEIEGLKQEVSKLRAKADEAINGVYKSQEMTAEITIAALVSRESSQNEMIELEAEIGKHIRKVRDQAEEANKVAVESKKMAIETTRTALALREFGKKQVEQMAAEIEGLKQEMIKANRCAVESKKMAAETTRAALASRESSHNKVVKMAAEIEFLRKEMRKDRQDVSKTAAKAEEMAVLRCEWRTFIKDSLNLRLSANETVLVVIQNNTNFTLNYPRQIGTAGYSDMPKSIAAFTRGQFSFRKAFLAEGILLFSYGASVYNLIIGMRTNSLVEFAVGFDRACYLYLDDKSSSSDLYTKLRLSNFEKDHENVTKLESGIIFTKKFQPRLSLAPVVTIQAKMTGGVLKILIFQD